MLLLDVFDAILLAVLASWVPAMAWMSVRAGRTRGDGPREVPAAGTGGEPEATEEASDAA
jgi:hypothetical protein